MAETKYNRYTKQYRYFKDNQSLTNIEVSGTTGYTSINISGAYYIGIQTKPGFMFSFGTDSRTGQIADECIVGASGLFELYLGEATVSSIKLSNVSLSQLGTESYFIMDVGMRATTQGGAS